MRCKILDKFWDIDLAPLRKDNGLCDPPWQKGKKIRIRSTLKGEKLLETIIHEILHAADWYKDEEWVVIVATDIARILTKLGYSCNDAELRRLLKDTRKD